MAKPKLVKGMTSPLVLLRKIRDVLGAPEPTQQKLDKLVKVVAKGFTSEVCSIYFTRPGDILELYASEGLKHESVHSTRLRFNEGLVGEIAAHAAPLNLPEAAVHPKFVYRPETGEEIYHSFVGVPILHSHKVIGVLVVQSQNAKIYSEDQLEVLQTAAMVIAEMAISNRMVDLNDLRSMQEGASLSHYHGGLKLSPGLARAQAVLHRPKVEIKRLVSDDPEIEQKRLERAIVELQQSVDDLIRNSGISDDDVQMEILETYRMFTHDRGWMERIMEAIRTGLTAEAAVKKVMEQMHARLSQTSSAYIRERIEDLEDLSTRLLYHLSGTSATAAHSTLPDEFVLIARRMGPAELLEYSHKKLKGIILEEGSSSSHIAIIAKMMDVPMVARVPNVLDIVQAGDLTIVDGDNGEVYIRPPEDVDRSICESIELRKQRNAHYFAMRDLPPETQDGVRVSLNINTGLYIDAEQLTSPDIDGIGLYRTELPYLTSSDFPSVDDQKKIYSEVFRHARGKRIVFRSFDIGGDKQVPYVQIEDEENPAMGWRATRIGLDRPAILRRQFRALVRAAAGSELHVMFPFIAEVSEFDATFAILEKEIERAKVEGHQPLKLLRVGSMIEIPSILYQLPSLLKRVQFVSVGSNDLLQFLFAWDRSSARLSGRYDPLSPIVIRVLRGIAQQCNAAGVEMGFCGEMATKPLEAMALIGCGIRSISMPPAAIGPVKAMVRSLNVAKLTAFMEYLDTVEEHSIRGHLERFAKDHGVVC